MTSILRLRQFVSGKVNHRWRTSPANTNVPGTAKTVLGVVALGVGGVIVYAHYDRVFKVKVDQTIPGFANFVDKAGEEWSKARSYFRRQPKVKEEGLVYQPSKPKPKPDLSKILKGEPAVDDKDGEKATENKMHADTADDSRLKADTSSVSNKDETTMKSDELQNTDAISKAGATTDDAGSEISSEVAKKEGTIDDSSNNDKREEVKASSDSIVKRDKEEENLDHVLSAEGTTPSKTDLVANQGSSNKDKETGVDTSKDTKSEEPVSEVVIPPLPESRAIVEQDPRLSDPSKSSELLEEAYKQFLVGCEEVSKAQQLVKQAWLELHSKVAATADVEGGVEQQIADAKQAGIEASNALKEAVDRYKEKSLNAERMVKHAQDSGYGGIASTIAAEMQLKAAETDLNLILVKEVIATARVAASCHGVVNKSKEELDRDLEAVSSSIDSSNKDKIIASLNKKIEMMDQRLKAVDAEHARNVMIALEVQRNELEELGEKKLEHSLEERDAKHNLEQIIDRKIEADKYHKAIAEQMRVAHEAYQEEKEKALEQLRQSLRNYWSNRLYHSMVELGTHFQQDLAKVRSRLAGIESMVESVADAGERTIRFQNLRKFSDSLVGSMERINSDMDYDVRRYVLGMDVTSLRESAKDDLFVLATLNSIPAQALQGGEGIQSEQQIRTRFEKVRRTCRNVALVPPEGAGPLMYLLSHIQAFLTFRRAPLPEVIEYSELEKMDTYAILYLAEKRMTAGDLAGVVDCIAFLKGEPMRIASDWLQDARLYLETRQAIELLQTYMRSKTFY